MAAAAAPPMSIGTFGPMEVFLAGEVLFVLPRSLPGMPPELVEAIDFRRQASLTGQCACGGRRHTPMTRPGHVSHGVFEHEDDCCASSDAIAEIIDRLAWEPE